MFVPLIFNFPPVQSFQKENAIYDEKYFLKVIFEFLIISKKNFRQEGFKRFHLLNILISSYLSIKTTWFLLINLLMINFNNAFAKYPYRWVYRGSREIYWNIKYHPICNDAVDVIFINYSKSRGAQIQWSS